MGKYMKNKGSKSIIIIVLAFILIFVLTVGISFYFFNKKNNENPYVWQGRYIWIDEGELVEVIDSNPVIVEGTIKERESKNTKIPTGEIEVIVDTLELINQSCDIPFEISNDTNSLEDTRLK